MSEERINRVLTQYRESPKLLFLLRTYLTKVAEAHNQVCDLPERFDLDTATGDQLTIVGKRMGWPRCHCVCEQEPAFGFECDDTISLRPLAGFCDPNTSWDDCTSGLSELCLSDDELYRKFLKVRRYQFERRFDLESLEECLRIFFGARASVLYAGQGRVVVAPGRDLTQSEVALLQLYPRVLPIALGIRITFHFGEPRVFGFGEGWGGFLEESPETTQASEGWQRTGKIFGFCDDWGGFCEPWETEGLPLVTGEIDGDGQEVALIDENGVELYTGPLTEGSAWMCRVSAPLMCEFDVHPYTC